MAINDEIESRYTEHGLRLIRFANGLAYSADTQLRALSRELRKLLRDYDEEMSAKELRMLIAAIQEAIATSYTAISFAQTNVLFDLVDTEVDFSMRAAGLTRRISEAATRRAAAGVLVHGASVPDHWQRQAQNLSWQVASAVRAAYASGTGGRALAAAVLGEGRLGQERGGALEGAQRAARGLVDSTVQSGTNAGRLASFQANDSDVNALSWFAILDTRVCPNCAMRAGKLYTVKLEPIGHSIPIGGPPPLHFFCRCILLPMKFPKGPPKDGGPTVSTFDKWIKKQPLDRQEELLGVGRTALWKEGKITLSDLVGQNGLMLTLGQLKAQVAKP